MSGYQLIVPSINFLG